MCCETKQGMFLHTHTHTLTQRAYFLGSSADLSSTSNYLPSQTRRGLASVSAQPLSLTQSRPMQHSQQYLLLQLGGNDGRHVVALHSESIVCSFCGETRKFKI